MSFFELKVDPREAQHARFAMGILGALRGAVQRRTDEGLTKREIAHRIGLDPSSLTRVLNGRVGNLTTKTISDIFWATEHEPEEMRADPLEELSSNYRPAHLCVIKSTSTTHGRPVALGTFRTEVPTISVFARSQSEEARESRRSVSECQSDG